MLLDVMQSHYTVNNLKPAFRESFEQNIRGRIETVDWQGEGYQDPSRQRDQSIKYFWGHNHDFGSFQLDGRMSFRHITILAEFMQHYGLPTDLRGKKVLDIGVWTGGTSLILAALGAEVVALEEVVKYADTVNYMADAFGIEKLTCYPMSVYDFDEHDQFDYILYSGVIYHVTDPVLSLRILFNALKDGGQIFVETFGYLSDSKYPLAIVESPGMTRQKGKDGELKRSGWNYYIPNELGLKLWMETVGLENIHVGAIDGKSRIKGVGTRIQHVDMLRAGLARPNIR